MTFQNPDTTYENETGHPPISSTYVGAGDTYNVKLVERYLYLAPPNTIASATIKLPPNPERGHFIEIATSQTITACTFQDSAGGAISGAPTTLAANTSVVFRRLRVNSTTSIWIRWR